MLRHSSSVPGSILSSGGVLHVLIRFSGFVLVPCNGLSSTVTLMRIIDNAVTEGNYMLLLLQISNIFAWLTI